MLMRISLCVACFLAAGLASAQDQAIKKFTADHVETFLVNELKINVRRTETQGVTWFQTPDGHFDFVYHGGTKPYIEFRYAYAKLRSTAAHIAAWNNAPGRATRARLAGAATVLGGTLACDAGLSFAQLRTHYDQLQRERVAFQNFADQHLAAPAADRVVQNFPAKAEAGKHKTGWDVEWDMVPNFNNKVSLLRIVSAKFTYKDKNGAWKSIMVARDIQLVEAFASYDDGVTAFLDLAAANRADKTIAARPELSGPPCVALPQILEYSKNPKLTIFREVHDDGLRWMGGYGKNNAYRGEKLVLMSIFQAVNYVYFLEYDFTDDGRIVCRLGFTAHNLQPRGKGRNKDNIKDGDVHLHVGCWRMQFDLGDAGTNQGGTNVNDYRLISRRFDPNIRRFKVADEPFGVDPFQFDMKAREGKALCKAEEFTTLRVQSNAVKNAHGRPIAYDLIPSRFGSVRGLLGIGDVRKENMDFMNYDFWITRTGNLRQPSYHKVPGAAAQRRPLAGEPATVWYSAPFLHVPRGEDFGKDGKNNETGVALATWIEFMLRPRDVFDSTPLYP